MAPPLFNNYRGDKMPFLMWAALAVAVLIIAGNSSKVVVEVPQVLGSAMQPSSRGFGALGGAIAAIVVIIAVIVAIKYRKGNDK